MHKFLKTIPLTGQCELDMEKAVKDWKDYYFISQWKEEYSLIAPKGRRSKAYSLNVNISNEQALELINRLKLFPIRTMFNSGRVWRVEKFIISEIERFDKLKKEKEMELDTLKDVLRDYENSLLVQRWQDYTKNN